MAELTVLDESMHMILFLLFSGFLALSSNLEAIKHKVKKCISSRNRSNY